MDITENRTDASAGVIVVADDVLNRLKDDLRKVSPYPDGTVVRFASVDPHTGTHYHYAALFAGGKWWFTGQGNNFFPKSATVQEFSALLVANGHRITGLELATAYASIEL